MNAEPKLTICIPTFNQIQFIRPAVESALGQLYHSFEVVVSDNHCTDGTSEYLAKVTDDRLRVVRPPEHLPVAKHFDFCASQARGEYITFLSSDDVLEPEYASRMAPYLDRFPTAAFAYCGASLIDGSGAQIGIERNIGGSRLRSSDDALRRFMRGSRCVFDTLMIRRRCFEACGRLAVLRNGAYFRELPDWDLDLRLALHGDVAYLDEVLVGFRFWVAANRDDNSRRLPRYVEEIGRMFDTTVQEIVHARPHLARFASKARKLMAVNCAIGAGELFGQQCYDNVERDVLKIHDSLAVKAVLGLHRLRLTPALGFTRSVKSHLRQQVKQLLYQG
jgi:glycosyltransferase involved in cell wall biosynthesis